MSEWDALREAWEAFTEGIRETKGFRLLVFLADCLCGYAGRIRKAVWKA